MRLRSKIMVYVFSILLVLLLVGWGVGLYLFNVYTHPPRMPLEADPSRYGLEFRDLEFSAPDSVVLKAWLILPPGYVEGRRLPALITTHGYSTNRGDILERSAALAEAGFVVLTFDWRGCGESGGEMVSGGLLERGDLRAAVDTLVGLPEVDPERIALYGFSMGATVAIVVAAEEPRIKAVVADSPYANTWEISEKILAEKSLPSFPFMLLMDMQFRSAFGAGMRDLDAERAAAALSPRPLLILFGDADRVVPPPHGQRVFDAAGEPKALHVTPGGGHFDNGSAETFQEVITPFFTRYLESVNPIGGLP